MKAETRCPTCHRKRTRTVNANARLWLLYHAIADGIKPQGDAHSAEVWHQYFKQRFLGIDEIVLPNKKVIQQAKSTADLDTTEFNEYMEKVEHWAAEHNVFLDGLETLT